MLSPRQRKCVELMAQGTMTQREIAKEINVSEKTICVWKKDSDFMGEYQALLKQNIQSLAARAYNTQSELLNAKSESVRYMVAKDILDRAGFKPDDNINLLGSGTVVIVDDCDQ